MTDVLKARCQQPALLISTLVYIQHDLLSPRKSDAALTSYHMFVASSAKQS